MPRQFNEVACESDGSVIAHKIMRSDIPKQTFSDVNVMARMVMRNIRLTTEHDPSALMPRPILYMNGTIRALDLDGELADTCGCSRLVVSQDKTVDDGGIDAQVRYELSDMQIARMVLRGGCTKGYPAVQPVMKSTDHEIPVKADITLAMSESGKPIIVAEVRNPQSIVMTRAESGYDYVNYIGETLYPQIEAAMRELDTGKVAEAVTEASIQQQTEEVAEQKATRYESIVYESLFSEDEKEQMAEQAAKAESKQQTLEADVEQAETAVDEPVLSASSILDEIVQNNPVLDSSRPVEPVSPVADEQPQLEVEPEPEYDDFDLLEMYGEATADAAVNEPEKAADADENEQVTEQTAALEYEPLTFGDEPDESSSNSKQAAVNTARIVEHIHDLNEGYVPEPVMRNEPKGENVNEGMSY